MPQDEIQIELLDDGRIKVTTDQVSMPNHASAEAFLRLMEELSGGEQKRVRKSGAHHHHHGHLHSHAHGEEEHSH